MYERSKLEWRSDNNQTRRVGESMRSPLPLLPLLARLPLLPQPTHPA
jgi:hypothetical protein